MIQVMKSAAHSRLGVISFNAGLLILWEVACREFIPPYFLPPPSSIFQAFVVTLKSGELTTQLGQTASVLATGFLLALVIGMLLPSPGHEYVNVEQVFHGKSASISRTVSVVSGRAPGGDENIFAPVWVQRT